MSKIDNKINTFTTAVSDLESCLKSFKKRNNKGFDLVSISFVTNMIINLHDLELDIKRIPNNKMSKETKYELLKKKIVLFDNSKKFIKEQLWFFEFDMGTTGLVWNHMKIDLFLCLIEKLIKFNFIDEFPKEVKSKLLLIKLAC